MTGTPVKFQRRPECGPRGRAGAGGGASAVRLHRHGCAHGWLVFRARPFGIPVPACACLPHHPGSGPCSCVRETFLGLGACLLCGQCFFKCSVMKKDSDGFCEGSGTEGAAEQVSGKGRGRQLPSVLLPGALCSMCQGPCVPLVGGRAG